MGCSEGRGEAVSFAFFFFILSGVAAESRVFFSFLFFLFFFSFRGYKKVISMLGGNLDSDRSNLVIDSRQARYIFLFS